MFAKPDEPPLPHIGESDQFANELDHMADCVINDAESLLRFHETLLFLRAYPPSARVFNQVEKILKSRGAVRISVVGEAFNLVNPSIFTSPTNPSSPAALVARDLQSRALRLGLVFGF